MELDAQGCALLLPSGRIGPGTLLGRAWVAPTTYVRGSANRGAHPEQRQGVRGVQSSTGGLSPRLSAG
jgi:hypothetical protein